MLMKWNPLILRSERDFITGGYVESILSNPKHLTGDVLYKSIYWLLSFFREQR